jgi:hypothetical protein
LGLLAVGRQRSGIRAWGLAENAFVWSSWQSPQSAAASAFGASAAGGVGVGAGGASWALATANVSAAIANAPKKTGHALPAPR